MIKLIVGTKGSGKTKAMIDMINDSVKTSKGNVVVVEKGMKLTYEVPNAARLIDLDEYKIAGGSSDLVQNDAQTVDVVIQHLQDAVDVQVSDVIIACQ